MNHSTETGEPTEQSQPRRRYGLHITLFVLTMATTTFAGMTFVAPPEAVATTDALFRHLYLGLPFSLLLLLFLASHEFGHYFAARYHGVESTLPYFIPFPLLFGTMGAVIRLRSPIRNRKALFDIGVAGPLAGFGVALVYLVVGILTSDDPATILAIHPEYRDLGGIPTHGLHFGDFALFALLRGVLVTGGDFMPPMNEMYHYPLLAVGWFGMFVTALNLIPLGQLDGGHILYAMFGSRQPAISRWVFRTMIVAGLGAVGALLYDATAGTDPNPFLDAVARAIHAPLQWISDNAPWWYEGWAGWLFWGLIVRFVVRIAHPPIEDPEPLGRGRMAVGWLAMAIFALTVSWTGIYDAPPANTVAATPRPETAHRTDADRAHRLRAILRVSPALRSPLPPTLQ